MGKVSVLQVQQDVPGNASREVFQGLFKDLGKQAMALEAILRTVCGRVDKMENWLTEVSFGMTELDQKLRNIAHNIDGTAVVDDEAQGPHRWATPQEDDKPLAPTVSKKLGTDKKAVRVTGMAAAILDRLATTSSAVTPATVDVEKVEKSNSKKKGKDKKNNSKKVKLNGSVEAPAPLPPVAESVQTIETKLIPPAPVVEPVAHETVILTTKPEFSAKPSTPIEKVADTAEPKDQAAAIHVHEPVEPVSRAIAELPATSFEPLASNGQSGTSSGESSPVMPSREVIESNFPEGKVERKSEVQAVSTTITAQVAQAPEADNIAPLLAQASTPTATTTKNASIATPTQKINDIRPIPIPSVSSILPTVQVERTIEPFVLKSPVRAALPSTSAVVPVTASELQVAPTGPTHESPLNVQKATIDPVSTSDPVAPQVAIDPVSTSEPVALQISSPAVYVSTSTAVPQPSTVTKVDEVPIRAFSKSHQDKPHASEAAGPRTDPLLPRRTPSRRSSKVIPRPSIYKKHEAGENDPSRRLSGNKHESHSRRASVSLQVISQEHEPQEVILQQVAQLAPTLQVVQQETPTPSVSVLTHATEQADIDEKSDESAIESSSDGTGSSSSDEDDEDDADDAEAGAAVEEISKTMIALKKLKRAHMLSPEEETELKDRAHKKWFQLKGHIKEKQKKDVTNILLKRKKNVFTVSSRIELLEEKSREIFAALKQMTNEMREKNDRATHETLRRRVTDIEQSLQSVDSRIASLSAPAVEKVSDLASEVISLRTTVQLQLATAQSETTTRHSILEDALASQRALVEALSQDVPTQLSAQAELFFEKLKQQPDYTTAIENLKRGLRRKADLKLLKELEARLLGLDAENEDCLVRCLSCHKEVVNPHNEKDTEADDQEIAGSGPSQFRKVNPGPSSARIYRSNVPFNAQPMVQESISEESPNDPMLSPPTISTQPQSNMFAMAEFELSQQFQSAGDSHASERAPAVRVPTVKWSTPTETPLKRDVKSAKAPPLSLMNITATRAILSPDRPISAPVVPMKKKNSAGRSKSLLKALNPQLQPPQ